MFNIFRKEIEWAGRPLILETGKIARQADGAVLVTYGETKLLCTVVAAKSARPDGDFFPLTVNYQEKTFAAGKIPGGFFKREGRSSERETLISRLIDRPIRPLFVDGFRNETQVICTVLSHDFENDPDVIALIGASAAITISGLPFMGPVGGARIVRKDGKFIVNPTINELESGVELDLVVAGTQEGVLMVESEAKELPEDVMLEAVMIGWNAFQPVIQAIIDLAEMCAKDPWDMPVPAHNLDTLSARLKDIVLEDLKAAYSEPKKQIRHGKINEARKKAIAALEGEFSAFAISENFGKLEYDLVRGNILNTGMRIDGRDTKTIRPIVAEVGILPRAHGSALFTRGETQALVVSTLGTSQDSQIIDALEGEYRQNFLLHYNFPPFSVGEVGRIGSPGRREIGHGKLAWRAIHPMMPTKDAFPYTVRIVSEITESNGSSSMATVCGSSLSLMDAGVPLAKPVAGIAMGLIKEGEKYAILSDIMGDEDHLGDMDFKVAGTEHGITALQMDIKITSITEEIMKNALAQAKDGRLHILGEMAKAITGSREEVSDHAPRITVFSVPKDKIRDVIGTGGKVIREITEVTGAKVNIDDEGTVQVSSTDSAAAERAIEWIKGIVAEPELGVIYNGKVVKVVDFGAFVNFLGNRDGLVHISEILPRRVEKVSDILTVGQTVKVKVIGFDDRGKVKLSMKSVDQETGQEISQNKE
ncbi:MAG: polyribonucleotide nucleotidyltransferase [Alphaproteobacteria bacterium GWF2_58_20]|nr:MAG: polyribonucleotide nucleotidyltransferase [Alphaproteobacteria bacterium GWF2_58_20]